MDTLRDTIRELTAKHLDAGHPVMGQCLTAVGWVGGTLPQRYDMTELPTSDVANSGFVVGTALAGRRPMYIVRYQGFQWFNAAMIVNYAAKSKALWNRPCPMLIRSIGMEGGSAPTTGGCHHSLFARMPGIRVIAPMTPGEWRNAYNNFMTSDEVVCLSEHRGAWNNSLELPNEYNSHYTKPQVVLFPISITRFTAMEAVYKLQEAGMILSLYHVSAIKPFNVRPEALQDLTWAKRGIVLDDEYPGGVAEAIALELHNRTGARMSVLKLEDRVSGFGPGREVLPPNAERIVAFVKSAL